MTFPGESTMNTLDAISRGVEFVALPESGRMVVLLGPTLAAEVEGDDLDALIGRGWVETDGEWLVVTEQGKYALRRWATRRAKG